MNPLHFYLWGHLKTLMYAEPVDKEHALHHNIMDYCQTICSYPGIFEWMWWPIPPPPRTRTYAHTHTQHNTTPPHTHTHTTQQRERYFLAPELTQPPVQCIPGTLSPWVTLHSCEAEYSPSSAKFKNDGTIPPQCLIKQRGNFNIYLTIMLKFYELLKKNTFL
jgi:hypothetical protein